MKDLIIVVADSYQEKVLDALLPRVPVASGTREFSYDIITNPGHDSGCYTESHELLRSSIKQYHFALVVFDFEGCGAEHLSKQQVEFAVIDLLHKNGWENRCSVIVIEPELENWMWVDNPNMEQAIGWKKKGETLYDWARKEGHLASGSAKPARPKETLEKALRVAQTPKSASIYKQIAAMVSYKKCIDQSFLQLINQLSNWFPTT